MSGLEAAGLAIGVLPVILSAVDNYQKLCSRPFSRYSSFSKEVDRWLTRLDTQKVILRKDCFLLLSDVIGSDNAECMLANYDHPDWADNNLDTQIAGILGDLLEQCMRTLKQIDGVLGDIEKQRVQLTEALEHENEQVGKGKVSSKLWKRQLKTKLKFSFSETHLSQDLTTITDFISDFKCLRSSLNKARVLMKPQKSSPNGPQFRELQLHRIIGEASQGVYEALQSACNKHIEHSAHLCVEVEQVSGKTVVTPQFKFSLAFASAAAQAEPLWFAIETIMNEIVLGKGHDNAASNDRIVQTLKRRLGPEPPSPPPEEKQRKGKRVTLQLPPPVACGAPKVPPIIQSLALQNRINGDFCDFLRRHCRCSKDWQPNVGVLGNKARWKSLVYPLEPRANAQQLRPMTLRDIISLISQGNRTRLLSMHQRLHLAKTISIAFLRHHMTEWGRACWESESICFFDINEEVSNKPIRLSSPHLNTRICGPHGTPPASQRAVMLGSRNTLLFNLGILFLEIAHSADWDTLKQRHRYPGTDQNRYADFFSARRIAKERFESGMPEKYHDVIEKLIECDFAQGDDLSKPELQAAFYYDVVGPLEDIEKRVRDLDLGI